MTCRWKGVVVLVNNSISIHVRINVMIQPVTFLERVMRVFICVVKLLIMCFRGMTLCMYICLLLVGLVLLLLTVATCRT